MPRLLSLTRIGSLSLMLAASTVLTGCVSPQDFAKVRLERDQLAEQLGHSQTLIDEANARADASQRQLAMQGNSAGTQNAMLSNLQAQVDSLQKQNDDLSQRYASAMAMLGSSTGGQALPTPLNNELTQFAQQYPDLVDFDAARGMVKFKSDVTFAVGDASITPKAKDVLVRFASILNSSGADGYELLVAGHTDSTPVTNERTKRLGHFNNWYLSAHRAISVGSELISDGVSPKRLGTVGYADERPVASNASDAGKAANRRVEVLILPTAARSNTFVDSTPTPSGATTVRRTRSTRTPASAAPANPAIPASALMNKDSGSAMNK